jgi:hypothetical protein
MTCMCHGIGHRAHGASHIRTHSALFGRTLAQEKANRGHHRYAQERHHDHRSQLVTKA